MTDLTRSRHIETACRTNLAEKPAFIVGPRQVGKTTLALYLIDADANQLAYLNWDIPSHRRRVQKAEFPPDPVLVFDELNQYSNWRDLVKGYYDQFAPDRTAIVTGSGRLDYYREGGDSLQGRYHYYRLHPYSLREMSAQPKVDDVRTLLQFGGFPEKRLPPATSATSTSVPIYPSSIRYTWAHRITRLPGVFVCCLTTHS